MKPGRELDALVAERVMGWKRVTVADFHANTYNAKLNEHNNSLTNYWHSNEPDSLGRPTQINLAEEVENEGSRLSPWSPSTDISAAWEVVKQIQRKGYPWPYSDLFHQDVDLDSLPFEICVRALKAAEAK